MKGPLAWLAAALLACAALALAYLPPRGVARDETTRSGAMTGPPTIERERANALAKEWRLASLDVRLHEWRLQVAPELERLRTANQPTVVTFVDTAWPRELRERATREIAAAWQTLGLGATKIGVAVIIEPERLTADIPARSPSAYLLPDSLEKHTCVAWSAARGYNRAFLERPGDNYARALAAWIRRTLGPCAFYAGFGRPGTAIERWLAVRQHRFAQSAAWDSQTARYELPWYPQPGARRESAEWVRWVYQQYPMVSLGCMAEHARACRDAVIGVVSTSGAVPRLSAGSTGAADDLPGSTLLLSEMVREFGHARFARFWSSELPPDSAFHIAMDTTLGDWVLSRQRAYNTTLDANPAPAWGTSLIGLSLGAFAVVLAMAAAARRQIG